MSFRTQAICSLLLAVCGIASAQDRPLTLGCDDPREREQEAQAIRKLAGDVVKRRSAHALDISVAGKVKKFIDRPPHDEPFSGVHYYFCDRKAGFILLFKTDESVFSGTLINEHTGAITPGGEQVILSPDRRAYFVSEQPDGLDGEQWKIYFVDGKLSWSGFSFISNHDHAHAYLEKPMWGLNGEFMAEAMCTQKPEKRWTVKLVNKDGRWEWSPKKKCPDASL